MEEPTKRHKQAVERMFAYIHHLIDYCLFYSKVNKNKEMKLQVYVDANYRGPQINKSSMSDAPDCRSTPGLAITLIRLLVVYCSNPQVTVSRSSTDAKTHA
jgi:hypothetical protein